MPKKDYIVATSPTVHLSVRVDLETANRFRELAKGEHRSVGAELRRLMEQRIAEADEVAA